MEELPAVKTEKELAIQQIEATTQLANSVKTLADFVVGGGLQAVLNGYAKTQCVKDILGGLTAHSGRDGLDARTLSQNAIEIVEQVEKVFEKYSERLEGKNRDPEVKDAETDFKKWQSST
jgi:hypothetical protein